MCPSLSPFVTPSLLLPFHFLLSVPLPLLSSVPLSPLCLSLPLLAVPPSTAPFVPLSPLPLHHSIPPQPFHLPFSILPRSPRPLCASLPLYHSVPFFTPLFVSLFCCSLHHSVPLHLSIFLSLLSLFIPPCASDSASVILSLPLPLCLSLFPSFLPLSQSWLGCPPSPALSPAANEQEKPLRWPELG